MKKILSIFALFLLFALFCPIFVSASEKLNISATSACLMEAESEKLIYSKNADKRMPMASTTKVMTAIVAIESNISLDTVIQTPKSAVGVEGSSIYLTENEKITFEALLYSLLLSSANDAAIAIAITVSGSVENFISQMNCKAEELGLTNTHFTNPHGLYDDEHYTTARDLACLMAYAMKNDVFAKITATERKVFPRDNDGVRALINHNKLLKTYDGVIGGKTGFTKKSGRCLVSVAEKDGLRLIAVTLNASNDWQDHSKLYDFGFDNYEIKILSPIELTLPIISGEKDVLLAVSNEIKLFTSKSSNIVRKIYAPRLIFANVSKGEEIGKVVYILNGQIIAQSPIIATESIEQVQYGFNLFEWLRNILKGFTKWNR